MLDGSPALPATLSNLAMVYRDTGEPSKAEPLMRRALALADGPLEVARLWNNLAGVYETEGRYPESEELYRKSLQARERLLGSEHRDTISSLHHLASVIAWQGRYTDAEPLLRRALEIGGSNAAILDDLGFVAAHTGRVEEAERCYRTAVESIERERGERSRDLLPALANYTALLRDLGRKREAARLEARARDIRAEDMRTNALGLTLDLKTRRAIQARIPATGAQPAASK